MSNFDDLEKFAREDGILDERLRISRAVVSLLGNGIDGKTAELLKNIIYIDDIK